MQVLDPEYTHVSQLMDRHRDVNIQAHPQRRTLTAFVE